MHGFPVWFLLAFLWGGAQGDAKPEYPWLSHQPHEKLSERVLPPAGYRRIPTPAVSFGAWLRGLPVQPGRGVVRLHDGRQKANQDAHHIVLDIDVGEKNLQQCADAVMRLRAEFLRASAQEDQICFRFTSGDKHPWNRWMAGTRPQVRGNEVSWNEEANGWDASYQNFRRYLNSVFMWAGTYSLSRELLAVGDPRKVEVGDVFIQGGFPGHAVLVADVAENETGERVFLLVQSFMPAQDMHVLKNPEDSGNPWYTARNRGELRTPEWTFKYRNLKRFSDTGCP